MAREHTTKHQRGTTFSRGTRLARIPRQQDQSDYQERQSKAGKLRLPPNTPGAVQCPECEVWIKALTEGQPRAHAPGGFSSNVSKGRFNCKGSGNLAEPK